MTIIHDGDGEMTRYDLTGEVVARARATPDGWVITDPDGGQSDPIPGAGQAREALAAWDHAEAAKVPLRRAAQAYRQARKALEDAIRAAHDAGVPQTQIAEIAGFTRQWIRQMLRR